VVDKIEFYTKPYSIGISAVTYICLKQATKVPNYTSQLVDIIFVSSSLEKVLEVQ